MNKGLVILSRRREELLIEIAMQRSEITEIALQWQRPLALADKGIQGIRFIRNHPGAISGGFAVLMSLRGIGLGGLVLKGWRLLYLYPSILSFGLKSFLSATRTPNTEAPLDEHAEEWMAEVDNQQIRKI